MVQNYASIDLKIKIQKGRTLQWQEKMTTVKNNIITERIAGGKVIYLSETIEGKRHDKKLADDEGHQFPKGSKLWQDTGYQGYKPDGVTCNRKRNLVVEN